MSNVLIKIHMSNEFLNPATRDPELTFSVFVYNPVDFYFLHILLFKYNAKAIPANNTIKYRRTTSKSDKWFLEEIKIRSAIVAK